MSEFFSSFPDDDKHQQDRLQEKGRGAGGVTRTPPTTSVVTQRPHQVSTPASLGVSSPSGTSSSSVYQTQHHYRPPATLRDSFQWDALSRHGSSRPGDTSLGHQNSSRPIMSPPPPSQYTALKPQEVAASSHHHERPQLSPKTTMSYSYVSPPSSYQTGQLLGRLQMSPKSPRQPISPRVRTSSTSSYQGESRSQVSPTSPHRRPPTSPRSHNVAASQHPGGANQPRGMASPTAPPRQISPRSIGPIPVMLSRAPSTVAALPGQQAALGQPMIAYRQLDFDSNSVHSEESYQGDGEDKK